MPKWNKPDDLPDADSTVLMRLNDEEFPVWPGYHDGEVWRNADATEAGPAVLGWIDLEEAAACLDGEREKR